MELAVGTVIGPYRITGRAGQGGMGVVWKAHDTVLDRPVAIKVLHGEDERTTERIVREARLAARLSHPNVVTIYEARREGASACIVMEWIAGESLAQHIPAGGLPLGPALAYAIPIARALEAAHAAGIVHRDLKPSNVRVAPSSEPKLLDFGIAKDLPSAPAAGSGAREDTLTTSTAHVAGTAAYMSPEQIRGQLLDARSDIFSFGAVFYELLSGRRAFQGADALSTMSTVLTQEPALPTHAGGKPLPAAAAHIVTRCLRKDPLRRFQTAGDLRAALEDLADTRDTLPVIPSRRVSRAWWWTAATVAAAIGAIWMLMPRGSPPRLGPTRQLTFDGGVALTPAFSPDGKLLAYASDRSEPGNLDLWIRQIEGDTSARLTAHPGPDWNPQFSPDGTRLLYLSGDQNIVEIPVLGAAQAPRPIAAAAGPFSVAATGAIAFVRFPLPSRSGPIFVIPSPGAAPEPRQPDCRSASRPMWSPEGDRMLFWGECGGADSAFWVIPSTAQGAPQRVPMPEGIRPQRFLNNIGWFRRGGTNGVLFSAAAELTSALTWLQLTGERVSIGNASTESVLAAISSTGQLIHTRIESNYGIWLLAPGSAEPRQLAAAIGHYAASRDGRTIVFGRLTGSRSGELVMRDLSTGSERVFASHGSISASVGSLWPQIAPDGRRVAYRVVGNSGGHYVLDIVTREIRRLASLQDFQLGSDWSSDGRRVLGECPPPAFGICDMDVDTGRITTIMRHPHDQLLYPSWSPDGRWVVFGRRKPGGRSSIWAARVDAERRLAPETTWVRLSPAGADCQRPRLSLDRSTLYYVAGAEGVRRLMRQTVDPATLAPLGDAAPAVSIPLEVMVVTGGFGPYPLIIPTERGVFFSTNALRGNLFISPLQ